MTGPSPLREASADGDTSGGRAGSVTARSSPAEPSDAPENRTALPRPRLRVHDRHPAQRGRARRPHGGGRDVARGGGRGVAGPDRGAQRRAQRLLGRARQRGTRAGAVPRARPGRRARARCTAYRWRSRRSSTSRAASPPSAGTATARPRRPTARSYAGSARRARSSSARRTCRSSAPGPTPSPSPTATRATRGDTGFTPGGSSGGTAAAVASGHGPDRHGRRRWRLDPHPRGVLRAVRAEAAARPGHDVADGAPLVGAGHGRPADPDGARLGDRLRRHPGQPADRPLAGGRGRLVRRGSAARARAAPDRLDDQAGDQGRQAASRARRGRARHRSPPRPSSATTYARSTRTTPTRRGRSCRSSSPASGPRRRRSSTTTGSSVVPGRPAGSAAGSRPRVIDFALRQTEKISAKANRSSTAGRRPAHARHRPPPASRRRPRPHRHRARVAQGDAGDRLRRAVEPRRQPRLQRALRHGEPTGCRSAASWSGRPTARRPCSAWPPSSRRARRSSPLPRSAGVLHAFPRPSPPPLRGRRTAVLGAWGHRHPGHGGSGVITHREYDHEDQREDPGRVLRGRAGDGRRRGERDPCRCGGSEERLPHASRAGHRRVRLRAERQGQGGRAERRARSRP